jgi:hypothetical protein
VGARAFSRFRARQRESNKERESLKEKRAQKDDFSSISRIVMEALFQSRSR